MMDETENNQVVDRSKVRILLCDNDSKSCDEVFSLLCKCSYQVTSARSARELIDALSAEGPNIDIILSEVDLPISKGFKLLKYIMRGKESHRIPVIMMSVQDEVSVVVKCLKLGAVDYLLKPLRTNELLNLWTHVWRRRKTLGLVEKNIFSWDIDLVASDPSDANTNSTTIFSNDTDGNSYWNPLPDMNVSTHREGESSAGTSLNPSIQNSREPNVPNATDQRVGRILSHPKKSELKIGESSAFFTYVKTGIPIGNLQRVVTVDDSATESEQPDSGDKLIMCAESSFLAINHQRVVSMDETITEPGKSSKGNALLPSWGAQVGNHLNRHGHGKASDVYQIDVGTSSPSIDCLQSRSSKGKENKFSATVLSNQSGSLSEFPHRSSQEKDENISTTVLLHQGSCPSEFPHRRNSREKDEQFSTTVLLHRSKSDGPYSEFPQQRWSEDKEEQVSAAVFSRESNSSQLDVSAVTTFSTLPYYFPGMTNQAMMPPSSTHLYQGTYPHDFARHPSSTMLGPYNPFSLCHPPYPSMMSSFPPYYPIQLNMQQGQMPVIPVWPPPMSSSPAAEVKQPPVDKREAALIKFRQKKKDRCFDKKIRYANRKTLAERRTRVRGQFVRQTSGVDVNFNSQPVTPVDDTDDDVEDDEKDSEE